MAYSIPMISNGVENQRPNNLHCLHLPIRTLHLPSFHQIIIGNLSNNKVWFDRPSLYHLRHSDWQSSCWSAASFSRHEYHYGYLNEELFPKINKFQNHPSRVHKDDYHVTFVELSIVSFQLTSCNDWWYHLILSFVIQR